MKIKIFFGSQEIETDLENTKTTKEIYKSLPLDGAASRWGDEVYFAIPIQIDPEKGATDAVEKGDIAYWPQGSSFCIFFGNTPASTHNQIRAASKVNIIGKIKAKDIPLLHKIKDGDLVIVEQA